MMRGGGGWDRASPRHKGKKISSQKNSSLSCWIPSIAGTFCFPDLAQAPGLGEASLVGAEQSSTTGGSLPSPPCPGWAGVFRASTMHSLPGWRLRARGRSPRQRRRSVRWQLCSIFGLWGSLIPLVLGRSPVLSAFPLVILSLLLIYFSFKLSSTQYIHNNHYKHYWSFHQKLLMGKN